MSKQDTREFYRLMHRAHLTDRKGNVHTGEALLIACMLHATGDSRDSQEMRDVQKIMKDHNVKLPRQSSARGKK